MQVATNPTAMQFGFHSKVPLAQSRVSAWSIRHWFPQAFFCRQKFKQTVSSSPSDQEQQVESTGGDAAWGWRYFSAHLPMPLTVLALLTHPVDGVEVVVGPHTWDWLLQEVQQVGGAARCPAPVSHGVVWAWRAQVGGGQWVQRDTDHSTFCQQRSVNNDLSTSLWQLQHRHFGLLDGIPTLRA